ncbi:hypothetical protein LWP59_32360 [Amycolatopsis acidiphila]|uniref:DUF4386 family protein n=1 Tax=Amycolatopsis acidiphila TaxID=715473 RepID=A0A558A6E1_9PSEU|nr:hypothetical protein [Amycolatopsis acidiphila]TVT19837.1 hypothetical protein FNH06_22705 [Amycolatopsis acidiphila]UIJ58743.1 hypothetical protein LWP59_32360 [Amycolatopsis acidiphila]GHG71676.1 hypothetical protein GCM10017788_33540 [Amycolatopsis acidiphila]
MADPATTAELRHRRVTGVLGLLAGLFTVLPIPLWFVYDGAAPDGNILTRILLTLIGIAFYVAFAAALRTLVSRRDPSLEWVGTLAFGTALLYAVLVMVSLSLEGGTAIASVAPVDPTQDGPLAPGSFLMYGAIARLVTAMFLIAVSAATWRTRVVARGVSVLGFAIAVFNLAFVPSVYFGGEASHFYSAVGWGATAFAASFQFYWVIAAAIAFLHKPKQPAAAPAPVRQAPAFQ